LRRDHKIVPGELFWDGRGLHSGWRYEFMLRQIALQNSA
jgi:hypothetical protein